MTCNFRVGQKVVCIDDRPGAFGDIAPIRKGVVYTVVGIVDGISHYGPDTGLLLKEVPPLPEYYNGYTVRRFRPVVTRKTDISIFKSMLNPSKERVGA